MSETRDVLEREIGARAVGTAVIDEREVPVAFASGEEQVVALLRVAAEHHWRVLPIGSGTKLGRGAAFEKPRFAISLRGHSGVVAYERGDGTITARAGSTLGALAEVARAGGDHLTPDVALPAHATLGGTIASGVSGIDRLRYGPLRHHVLGLRVALGDGRVVKSGGRLVKNVTGFDLHRLHAGSRGSTCVILEATLRLFPLPRHETALTTSFFGRAPALAAARALAVSPVRATCVVVEGPVADRWQLTVGLAGRPDVLAWEVEHAERLAGRCERHEGPAARVRIEDLRDREALATCHASLLPGRLEAALGLLDAHADGQTCSFLHPGVATLATTPADGRALDLATGLRDLGASVALAHLSVAERTAFDPLATLPAPARALMTRVRAALDPAGRFAGTRSASELHRA